MGVYADSSPDPFDDPKVETIVELLTRIWGSAIGVVSTAFIADATPIALTGHTRFRANYGALIDQALHGVTNYSWTPYKGADVFVRLPIPASLKDTKDFSTEEVLNSSSLVLGPSKERTTTPNSPMQDTPCL